MRISKKKVYQKYKINKVQSLEDKFDYKKVYNTDYSNSDRKLTLVSKIWDLLIFIRCPLRHLE